MITPNIKAIILMAFCFMVHFGYAQIDIGIRGGMQISPNNEFELLGPSVGVELIKNAQHHVFTVVDIQSEQLETNTQDLFEFNSMLSYQFEIHMLQEKQFHPSIGAYLNLAWSYIDNEPKFNSFKTRHRIFEPNLSILPACHYKIGRTTFNLLIPIELLGYTYSRVWVGNPSIPPAQQNNSFDQWEIFDADFQIIISVAYQFNR